VKLFKAIFEGFSRTNYFVGEFGNGMKMKLVANLLVAIHNVAAAEAVLFAKKLGLDTQNLIGIIGDGAGGSRMLQVRGPMMLAKTWSQATMKNRGLAKRHGHHLPGLGRHQRSRAFVCCMHTHLQRRHVSRPRIG